MNIRKYAKKVVVGGLAVFSIAATAFAVAFPAPTVCAVIDAYEFDEVSERFYVPPNSSPEQIADYQRLIHEARKRIGETYGEPESEPVIVFFDDPQTFSPLFLNEVGQGPSVGSRSCLIIGPRGQSVDVIAHELIHTEIHHRVGAWGMLMEIPAWFDEGVAMQVDYRERFIVSPESLPDTSYVRAYESYSDFSSGEQSYAAARREVMELLAKTPANRLYSNLARIRNGEPFERVFE